MDDLLKKLTPGFIRKVQRKIRDKVNEQIFIGKSNKEVFEKIYSDSMWGVTRNKNQAYCSGDGSHDDRIVSAYVEAIDDFVKNNAVDIKKAVDLGCGDFNIGSRIMHNFESYIAIDVAENIIKQDRKAYKRKGLKFLAKNITEDALPKGDVAFVRQVLQHLSNGEIKKFVTNMQGCFDYVVVTESISNSIFYKPNKDMPTGPSIRIHKKSGIDLTKCPFDLKYIDKQEILRVKKGRELIVTVAYKLK
jgi:hypothetical protein